MLAKNFTTLTRRAKDKLYSLFVSTNAMSSDESCRLGVIPYLLSPDCQKHLRWIENALGGKAGKLHFKDESKAKVMHCCAKVNEGIIYLADGEKEDVTDVQNLVLHMDVKEPNDTWKQAHAHGATTQMDLKMQSWGSLYGQFRDPFGFLWSVSKGAANGVTAYLCAPTGKTCENMIKWVNDALKGQTKGTHHWPDGKIMHCEISVNGGTLYMSDGPPDRQEVSDSPNHAFILHMDVNMPSLTWNSALEKGATSIIDLKVQEWGDMYGIFMDEFGFQWGIRELEDVTPTSGLIPTFITPDCDKHIDWIKTVFSGKVKQLYHSPENKIAHCMMEINKGYLYLCDAACVLEDEKGSLGEPRGVTFQLEVADPDALWKKALANNAIVVVALKMQFWGEVYGTFKDPMGYVWALRKPSSLVKQAENGHKEQEE